MISKAYEKADFEIIEFTMEDLSGLNAVVVEIQDVGARYFNYTKDVFRLMDALKSMKDLAPSTCQLTMPIMLFQPIFSEF